MNATRHNMYNDIHKALRACMSDTLLRVARCDSGDDGELAATLDALDAMLALNRLHLQHEASFVHPAMEARRPGSALAAEDEHAHHEHAMAALQELATRWRQAAPAQRAGQQRQLHAELARFVGDSLLHMALEEEQHNAVLWECYSDAELLQIEAAIVGSIAPPDMMAALRWMLVALTPDERAALLRAMRAGAPPEAVAGVLDLARTLLPSRDMAKLDAALLPAAA